VAQATEYAYNRRHFLVNPAKSFGHLRGHRPMSYSKIPAGKDLPNDIYVAIEIPANHAPKAFPDKAFPKRQAAIPGGGNPC